jgi:hypothetical protein
MFRDGAGSATGRMMPYIGINPSFLCTIMKGNAPHCPKPPSWWLEAQVGENL